MIMTYLLLGVGFVLLVVGTKYLVDGASAIASRFGVSNLAIGITVVGFCTSVPELYTVLYADFEGAKYMAVDIVLGSNVFNILFILGISAIIYPLTLRKSTVWKEVPMTMLAAAVICIMANYPFHNQGESHLLTRIDGLILLILFGLFMFYVLTTIRKRQNENNESKSKPKGLARELIYTIGGLILIAAGGKWGMDNAIKMANILGLNQQIIGLTVVGIGTSVPELVASTLAAHNHNSDLAIGNIIGSNIFNICFILGVGSLAGPLSLPGTINFNAVAAMAASMVLFISVLIGKTKYLVKRWEGIVFLISYSSYIVYIS
jgi:cation:H+ antiporter